MKKYNSTYSCWLQLIDSLHDDCDMKSDHSKVEVDITPIDFKKTNL